MHLKQEKKVRYMEERIVTQRNRKKGGEKEEEDEGRKIKGEERGR